MKTSTLGTMMGIVIVTSVTMWANQEHQDSPKVWTKTPPVEIFNFYGFSPIPRYPLQEIKETVRDPENGVISKEIVRRRYEFSKFTSFWSYANITSHETSKPEYIYKCVVDVDMAIRDEKMKAMLFSKQFTKFLGDHGVSIDKYAAEVNVRWRKEGEKVTTVGHNMTEEYSIPGSGWVVIEYLRPTKVKRINIMHFMNHNLE